MNWITLAKKKAQDLKDYTEDLEAKNEKLRNELQMIAAGFYFKEHDSITDDYATKLKLRAAKALANEGNMQNRKANKYIF